MNEKNLDCTRDSPVLTASFFAAMASAEEKIRLSQCEMVIPDPLPFLPPRLVELSDGTRLGLPNCTGPKKDADGIYYLYKHTEDQFQRLFVTDFQVSGLIHFNCKLPQIKYMSVSYDYFTDHLQVVVKGEEGNLEHLEYLVGKFGEETAGLEYLDLAGGAVQITFHKEYQQDWALFTVPLRVLLEDPELIPRDVAQTLAKLIRLPRIEEWDGLMFHANNGNKDQGPKKGKRGHGGGKKVKGCKVQ